MESGKQLVGAMSVFLLLLLMIVPANAALNNYFSYRMNFYNQQLHVQTINFSGNLSVTVPANFTVYNFTGGATNASGMINWSAGTNAIINYTLQGPATCIEGTRYFSNISIDGTVANKFTFVCTPDSKIVDYKAEYGHGDANYLTEDFIPNDTSTLFNLIRVFNIGNFLEPNEDAFNATINCSFPNMPVRTYGRVEVTRSGDNINGGFFWERVEGGYWFRIGVLSQDIEQKPIGYKYNISCTSLSYDFSHHRATASFANKSLEVRSKAPFNISVTDNGNYLTYTIRNIEKYSAKSVVFNWLLNNFTRVEELNTMATNDTIKFDVFLEGSGNVTFRVDFIPSWFANSRNPAVYTQARSDAYNIDTRPARIVSLDIQLLRAVNQTTQDTRTSQQKTFRVELSDFGETIGNQAYRTRLLIFDYEGKPSNASSTPRVNVYDPLRNLIVNSTMTAAETGVYTYNYTTSQSQTTGVYETIVEVNISDVIVKPNDFWELENSPAQVRINSIVDDTTPTIVADVLIENEGSADSEYQYEYCVVVNETNQCGGDDDVDFASAAKLVKKGERFNPLLTLNVPNTGEYFFKVIVFFGTESSGATKKFKAVEAPAAAAPTTQQAGTKQFDADLSTAQSVKISAGESDIKLLTFDRYTSHIITLDTITANSVIVTIRSVPVTIVLKKSESKDVDINRDGINDIRIKLNDIVNFKADITITKLPGALLIPKRGCLEDWVCTDWSRCYSDGLQIRNCLDRNECNTIYDKPTEKRSCFYTVEQAAAVDLSGIAEYFGATQSEIRLFSYIVMLAFIFSAAMFAFSLLRPKSRLKRLYKILDMGADPQVIKDVKNLELLEENLERKITMLDHAYNKGSIDESTRNKVKVRLRKKLTKTRRRIAELKLRD